MSIIRMGTKRKVDKLGGNGKFASWGMYFYTTRFFVWACILLLLGCGLPFTKREIKSHGNSAAETKIRLETKTSGEE